MHLGNALRDLGQNAQARACFDKALEIDPKLAEAYYNRGYLSLHEVDTAAALRDFDRTIEFDPQHAMANRFSGMVRLLHGDYARGWPQYEWRWRGDNPADEIRDFGAPQWDGRADIKGKRILVHAEQGFGDTIQFVRYVPMVAALGAHVVLEVQPALKALVAGFPGVAELFVRGDALPRVDFQSPLLSLPLAFKTDLKTIPAAPSYLHADPALVAAWAQRVPATKGKRIGFACSGRAAHKNDRNRTLKLADFMAVASPGQQFVCLQNEVRAGDQAWLRARSDVLHFGSELGSFSDTAALIQAMDLVVTVDTSVAHLAGALGKPTFVLLPYKPDWRWLLKRSDSPWYPSMRLFRQAKRGDWHDALAGLRLALQA